LTKFGLLGALSLIVNLAVTTGLHELLGAAEETAFAVALATVLAMNFALCRYFVFERASEGDAGRQLSLFVISSLGFRGVELLAFFVVHTFLGVQYVVAILSILATSVLVKYLFFRSVVFG
jgi:putative flippase GtrA